MTDINNNKNSNKNLRPIPKTAIRRGLINNMMNQSWKEETFLRLSEKDTEHYRERARQIIKETSPKFMTTPRDVASGETVIPYIHIEKDLYGFYFKEGAYDNMFEPGIARIAAIELQFDRSLLFMREYMTLKKILEIIMEDDDEISKYDENLNGLSFKQLYEEYGMMIDIQKKRSARRLGMMKFQPHPKFSIVGISSFDEAHKYLEYTDHESPWCLCNEERKFGYATGKNKRMTLYFVLMDGYKDIKRPNMKSGSRKWANIDYKLIEMFDEDSRPAAYDEYGLSMMIIFIDRDGSLIHCVPRYNHDLNEYSRDYLDEEQLSMLLGRNFYETFKPAQKK